MRGFALVLAALFLGSCTQGGERDTTTPSPTPPDISIGAQLPPAANVVSPAPDPIASDAINGECLIGPIRADHVEGPELLDLLGSHVPTWLPQGFGLFAGWKDGEGGSVGEGGNGGIWTDAQCRLVRLDVFPGAAGNESPRPDGEWVLTDHSRCSVGSVRDAPCSMYHAQADGEAFSLATVGLSDEVAARVVDGIRL